MTDIHAVREHLEEAVRLPNMHFHYSTTRDAVRALLADHARLVGEVEKVNATLADIDGGLELLRLAIAASDPKAELLVRVKDLAADLEHVAALTLQPTKGA